MMGLRSEGGGGGGKGDRIFAKECKKIVLNSFRIKNATKSGKKFFFARIHWRIPNPRERDGSLLGRKEEEEELLFSVSFAGKPLCGGRGNFHLRACILSLPFFLSLNYGNGSCFLFPPPFPYRILCSKRMREGGK